MKAPLEPIERAHERPAMTPKTQQGEAQNYADYQQRIGAPLTFFTGIAAQAYAAAATRDDVSHQDAMRVALQAVETARSALSAPSVPPGAAAQPPMAEAPSDPGPLENGDFL